MSTSSGETMATNAVVVETSATNTERTAQPMTTHPPPAVASGVMECRIDSDSEGSDIEVTYVDISILKAMSLDPIPSQGNQFTDVSIPKVLPQPIPAKSKAKLPAEFDMITYTLTHLRKHLPVNTLTIPNEIASNWTGSWLDRNLRNVSMKSYKALCDSDALAATLVPSFSNVRVDSLPDTNTSVAAGLHRREQDPHYLTRFIRDAHQCTPWRLKRHLTEPSGEIQALVLVSTPDNMYCAIGAWADKLEAYNKPGNMCMYNYLANTCQVWKTHQAVRGPHHLPHYMTVNGVRYSPSTDTLITCGLDRTVQVWSTKSFEQLSTKTLPNYPQRLTGLDSARTSLTAIYDDMGVIRLINTSSQGFLGKQVTKISLDAKIQSLSDMLFINPAASPRLVTSYESLKIGSKWARVTGHIQLWDITEARAVEGVKVPEGPVFCLDYCPASQLLASGNATKHDLSTCRTNALRLTDTRHMHLASKFTVQASIVNAVKFRHLSLLEHQGNSLVDNNEGLQSVHWLPNASLVTGGADCKIKCWDIRRSDPLQWQIDDPDSPITCSELQG
ncbi:hypothetical protein H4R35_005893 [Dimargaris xerosporica]|nr:hypothetical protein H4R35_005893 [Dimargaris xerosporica]